MRAKLFSKLVDTMQKFIDSDERCKEPDFYSGKQTATLLAQAAAAVYDGMTDAAKLQDSGGEE